MRTRSDLSTTQGNLSFLLPMFIDLRVPDYFPRRRLLSLRLGDSIWKDGSFTCVFLFNLLTLTLCMTSTTFIFLLALIGVFYPYNRGALFTALVVIYALTSSIAGYTATSIYMQLEGTNWV
ncbi:hypothetical protein B296_00013950 [Ensete ventricosum]|uniref:Transmembrane 9 superfamily member n=1 Tax=Ensete ventricosum TaxID=4639 RepID=A0A427ADF3_ENSVE|nr:hypothetical protein B296_00013950 [Ensete ventricosum]